jgi:DDE family transposase
MRNTTGELVVDDFAVDHDARTATCPAGWTRSISRAGYANFGVACRECALRTTCTANATGKSLWVRPHDALQRTACRQARNPQWLSQLSRRRIACGVQP